MTGCQRANFTPLARAQSSLQAPYKPPLPSNVTPRSRTLQAPITNVLRKDNNNAFPTTHRSSLASSQCDNKHRNTMVKVAFAPSLCFLLPPPPPCPFFIYLITHLKVIGVGVNGVRRPSGERVFFRESDRSEKTAASHCGDGLRSTVKY